MDGCIGLVMKIASSLIILVLLSGCWCGVEEKDTSNVPDYFSGCWDKFARKERKSVEDKKAAEQNNLEDTNNKQGK